MVVLARLSCALRLLRHRLTTIRVQRAGFLRDAAKCQTAALARQLARTKRRVRANPIGIIINEAVGNVLEGNSVSLIGN